MIQTTVGLTHWPVGSASLVCPGWVPALVPSSGVKRKFNQGRIQSIYTSTVVTFHITIIMKSFKHTRS